jgi:hypothetical protein
MIVRIWNGLRMRRRTSKLFGFLVPPEEHDQGGSNGYGK